MNYTHPNDRIYVLEREVHLAEVQDEHRQSASDA